MKLKRYLGKKGVYEKEWDSSAKEKFTYGIDGAIKYAVLGHLNNTLLKFLEYLLLAVNLL